MHHNTDIYLQILQLWMMALVMQILVYGFMLLFTSALNNILGFEQLRYNNTPTDSILRFYAQNWGFFLPEEHISLKNPIHDPNNEENDEENDEENGGDLLPTTPPPIIDVGWMRLLIRAEYLRIYKWVEEKYTAGKAYRPPAIVVTGQPGIGQYSVIDMRSFFLILFRA